MKNKFCQTLQTTENHANKLKSTTEPNKEAALQYK